MNTRFIRSVCRFAPAVVLAAALAAGTAAAEDFSTYSTDELLQLRQENQVAVEDRDAFREALQSRMQAMSPEERASVQQEYGFGRGSSRGSGAGNAGGGGRRGGHRTGRGRTR